MEWYEFALVQAGVLLVMYTFFRWQNKREAQKNRRPTYDDNAELQKLRGLRSHSLSMPLSEATRPSELSDIVGQAEAIKALRAALCGSNPQHILIYGPPGVGKTCAARLILEEAKANVDSPFNEYSQFIELDATCIRFDERAIADPLLGCVHDPIYQGAGALGSQGIPQPKPGAVTKAHCGVLFLDEIGELHPFQMNKLLKVLEDRCVHFESSYYSRSNTNIPAYIHDIFKNGLPADFRLIGATTRSPEEIPPALRSRCVEIFFSPLSEENLMEIGARVAKVLNKKISENALELCAAYASSGRDCVNIMQLAGGANDDGEIKRSDVEWVANVCRYTQKYAFYIPDSVQIGCTYGLGVGHGMGVVLEIECSLQKSRNGGRIAIHGAADEEEIDLSGRRLLRRSLAYASVENVVRAVHHVFGIDCRDYDIIFNIPGGIPVDGPSAGAAFCATLISVLTQKPIKAGVAVTGEVTPTGEIRAVGGIRAKVEAAMRAGASCVIIPEQNAAEGRSVSPCVKTVNNIRELMRFILVLNASTEKLQERAGLSVTASMPERIITANHAAIPENTVMSENTVIAGNATACDKTSTSEKTAIAENTM